jgi:protein-tyrosine-phosphatase
LRPDLEVDSAGLHVAIPISEEVRDYLRKLDAEQYLKKAPESLGSKRLQEYDCIVAMDQSHRDGVLALCPECESRIFAWNIEDPYFMEHDDAERVYRQIEDKVRELAKSL